MRDRTRRRPSRDLRRPLLGIMFECCNVRRHIFGSKDGTAYAGACRRCGGRVLAPIGPGGTPTQFFGAH